MVSRSGILSILCLAILTFVGMNSVMASDAVEKYTFKVGDFSTLRIQDNVNVVYHCSQDTAAIVTYRGTKDFDDAFILTNNHGTLRIQVNTEDVGKPDLPVLHVYSNRLTKVENYSDFHLEIENPVVCEKFVAKLIGNGTIDMKDIVTKKLTASVTAGNGTISISGTADAVELRMTGTGTIQASELKAESVNCRILGGGTIDCCPEKSLSVHGIGSTQIKYTGDPAISHKGGGKLIKN